MPGARPGGESPPGLPVQPIPSVLQGTLVQHRRRALTRNAVLITSTIALLLLAGGLYWWLNSPDAAPADQYVGFYCPRCAHFFELSQRDFERLYDQRQFRTAPGGMQLLLKCEKCGQFTAERADRPPDPNTRIAPPPT